MTEVSFLLPKKHTQWATTSVRIAKRLSKRCQGGSDHQHRLESVVAFGAVGTANLSKTAEEDPAEELRVPVLLDPTACGAGGAMGGGTMMARGPGPAL